LSRVRGTQVQNKNNDDGNATKKTIRSREKLPRLPENKKRGERSGTGQEGNR